MTVYLVGAGPGDPGLLTVRAAALLGVADVVVHDRLVDPAVLDLAPGAELVDVGKRPGGSQPVAAAPTHAARQAAINELLVTRGRSGATVVRLKGGDPFVFGRGGEEAEALSAAGVAWEIVPGLTSALAVPASRGVPVTHRGLSTSVTVVTGQVGEPTAPGGVDWESLARAGGTVVVVMGVANRAEIARRLQEGGRSGSTPVLATQWGTTAAERTVRTTLGALGATPLEAPAVIVIGAVAGLDLAAPAGGPLAAHGALAGRTVPMSGPLAGRTAPMSGPLAGRTVVLARDPERVQALRDAVLAAGGRVLTVPATVTRDPVDPKALTDAAGRLRAGDWLVCTSATAVHRFLAHVADLRQLAGVRIAAVGPATADALAEHRLVADLVPERHRGAGLVEALRAAAPPGRALFPRARGAAPVVAEGLRAAGWTVEEVEAYATVAASVPGSTVRARLASADAVVFAAPSAIEAWTGWRDPEGRSVPVPPAVVCIGPTTAAAARACGLAVAAEPATPAVPALVASLVAALAGHDRS